MAPAEPSNGPQQSPVESNVQDGDRAAPTSNKPANEIAPAAAGATISVSATAAAAAAEPTTTTTSSATTTTATPRPATIQDSAGLGTPAKLARVADPDDKDFDPTAEALVDEIDDERTLEEEEALQGANGPAVQEELDDLKRESEMPIEELLAYYQRLHEEAQDEEDEDEDEEEEDDEDEEDYDEDDENEDDDTGGRHNGDRKRGRDTNADSKGNKDNQSSKDGGRKSDPKSSSSDTKDTQSEPPDSGKQGSQGQKESSDTAAQSPTSTVAPELETTAPEQRQELASNAQPTNLNATEADPLKTADLSSTHDSTDALSPKHPMTEFTIEDDAPSSVYRTLLGYELDDSDDMDEDYSYSDESSVERNDWRREIHVGPEHQADVPDGLSEYDNLPPYQLEDKLVWRCNDDISDDRLIDYLKETNAIGKRSEISVSPASVPKISQDNLRTYRERAQAITANAPTIPTVTTTDDHSNPLVEHRLNSLPDVYMNQSRKRVRINYELEQENALDGVPSDDCETSSRREDNSDSNSQDARPEVSTELYFQDEEQLLFLLLQCNYNFSEALRRRQLDPTKYFLHEPMTLWSQEECLSFEQGLRTYGKDFFLIRNNQIPTRTCAEVVHFYYLWKKSERHDAYTTQYKIDRKRCLSHPGTTDYMDRFIEDNESALNASTSITPTPTPTESTVGMVSNADILNDVSSLGPLCQPDGKSLPLHPQKCARISQDLSMTHNQANYHNHHHVHQSAPTEMGIGDEGGQKSPIYIGSNTLL